MKHYIAMAGQITRGKRNFDPKADNLYVSSRWSSDEQAVYYLVEYDTRFMSQDPEFPDAVATASGNSGSCDINLVSYSTK